MSTELRQRKKGGVDDAVADASPAAVPESTPSPPAPSEASSPVEPTLLERYEPLLPLLLLLLGAFTRFYRLDRPNGVVFDEFHFGRFTNQYHAGTYLFDIHPPLGKLVLYGMSTLAGYDHTVCGYSNIQDVYAPDCKYVWLRATSAAFGSATVPLMYLIARGFNASIHASIIAALLFTFDGLNVGEARLILIDSQLIFWCAATLTLALGWWRDWNAHWRTEDAREVGVTTLRPFHMTIARRVAWVLVMGVSCANTVSIKFTGLATPGMIAVESFAALLLLKRSLPIVDLLGIAAVVVVVFVSYYFIHFALLPNTGDGDGFMSLEFQRTLRGGMYYDPNATSPNWLQLTFDLNAEMLRANARIEQRHAWDSVWWEWPLNLRGVLYYSKDAGWTYTEGVYLLANPIVSWMVLFFMLVGVILLGLFIRLRTHAEFALGAFQRPFACIGYCFAVFWLNLLPYMAVSRSCFIYHYMPALMYGELLTALVIDRLASKRYMPFVLKAVTIILIASFVYFAPWVYAFPLTPEGHSRRRWLRRWD